MVNEWTRNDLPSVIKSHRYGNMHFSRIQEIEAYKDDVVDHLNANHPKRAGVEINYHWRNPDAIDEIESLVRDRDRWCRAHSIVEQERDQAREQAAKMCRERDGWRECVETLERERDEAKQAYCDLYDGDVAKVAEWKARAEAAERERDEWRAKAETAEQETSKVEARAVDWSIKADQWKARAQMAESDLAASVEEVWAAEDALARTAPTVTREQVKKALTDPRGGAVDAVCALFGVEAEQPDPVEAKARELYGAANAGTPWGAVVQSANEGNRVDREVVREYRAIAAHVLGQETGHE